MSANAPIRARTWTITLAVSAAALVYLFCSFLPTARAIRKVHDEIHAHETFVAQTTTLPAALIDLQKKLDRAKNYSAECKRFLPTAAGLPSLLERVTRQADMAGARTTRFEPQTPRELDELQMLPIRFGASGGYANICRMLAELEQMPERIWVDDLRIETSREAGQEVQCDLKLTIFSDESEKSN